LVTLLVRVEAEGPLPAREAVRLGARLARTIEALHADGRRHGAIGPDHVLLPTKLLHDAVVRRPGVEARDDADDALGIARLLHFALTAHAAGAGDKLPPLAVFDCGDEDLEVLVDDLVRSAPGTTSVAALRARLDEWLAREGAPTDESLPWEGESRANVDLSSLPPPPAAPSDDSPRITLEELDDEDADRPTVPGEALAPVSPRRPRIVPPKLKGKGKLEVAVAPPAATAPASGPSSSGVPLRASWVVGGIAAITVGSFLLLRQDDARDPTPASAPTGDAATPGSSVAPTASSGGDASSVKPSPSAVSTPRSSPTSSSTAQAQSSTSRDAATSASAGATGDERRDRCVMGALPPDTFEGTFVDFAPVCAAGDVLDGASRFRETIVRGGHGRPVTSGMREWSQLGFFELAAFAAIHTRCCDGGALSFPTSPAGCPSSVETAVESVVRADASSKKELKRALTDLEKAFRCVSRSGAEKRFGGHPPLSGGEGTPLTKILARLSKLQR
jgi:hypothetical protein